MKDDSDKRIAQKIFQATRLENKKVLEIGCGDGRITKYLAGSPRELVAIDPDRNQIRIAREGVSGVDFQAGTGEKLSFPDHFFDLIIFTLSLHHQNSGLAIAEASRVLKDDGQILVIEPVIEGELERVFALAHNENQAKLDAQRSIDKSGLIVKHRERFTANWVFDDKDELCQSIFHYYDLPFDPKVQDEIVDMIGEKADDHPIELTDTMEIQVLVKGKDTGSGLNYSLFEATA